METPKLHVLRNPFPPLDKALAFDPKAYRSRILPRIDPRASVFDRLELELAAQAFIDGDGVDHDDLAVEHTTSHSLSPHARAATRQYPTHDSADERIARWELSRTPSPVNSGGLKRRRGHDGNGSSSVEDTHREPTNPAHKSPLSSLNTAPAASFPVRPPCPVPTVVVTCAPPLPPAALPLAALPLAPPEPEGGAGAEAADGPYPRTPARAPARARAGAGTGAGETRAAGWVATASPALGYVTPLRGFVTPLRGRGAARAQTGAGAQTGAMTPLTRSAVKPPRGSAAGAAAGAGTGAGTEAGTGAGTEAGAGCALSGSASKKPGAGQKNGGPGPGASQPQLPQLLLCLDWGAPSPAPPLHARAHSRAHGHAHGHSISSAQRPTHARGAGRALGHASGVERAQQSPPIMGPFEEGSDSDRDDSSDSYDRWDSDEALLSSLHPAPPCPFDPPGSPTAIAAAAEAAARAFFRNRPLSPAGGSGLVRGQYYDPAAAAAADAAAGTRAGSAAKTEAGRDDEDAAGGELQWLRRQAHWRHNLCLYDPFTGRFPQDEAAAAAAAAAAFPLSAAADVKDATVEADMSASLARAPVDAVAPGTSVTISNLGMHSRVAGHDLDEGLGGCSFGGSAGFGYPCNGAEGDDSFGDQLAAAAAAAAVAVGASDLGLEIEDDSFGDKLGSTHGPGSTHRVGSGPRRSPSRGSGRRRGEDSGLGPQLEPRLENQQNLHCTDDSDIINDDSFGDDLAAAFAGAAISATLATSAAATVGATGLDADASLHKRLGRNTAARQIGLEGGSGTWAEAKVEISDATGLLASSFSPSHPSAAPTHSFGVSLVSPSLTSPSFGSPSCASRSLAQPSLASSSLASSSLTLSAHRAAQASLSASTRPASLASVNTAGDRTHAAPRDSLARAAAAAAADQAQAQAQAQTSVSERGSAPECVTAREPTPSAATTHPKPQPLQQPQQQQPLRRALTFPAPSAAPTATAPTAAATTAAATGAAATGAAAPAPASGRPERESLWEQEWARAERSEGGVLLDSTTAPIPTMTSTPRLNVTRSQAEHSLLALAPAPEPAAAPAPRPVPAPGAPMSSPAAAPTPSPTVAPVASLDSPSVLDDPAFLRPLAPSLALSLAHAPAPKDISAPKGAPASKDGAAAVPSDLSATLMWLARPNPLDDVSCPLDEPQRSLHSASAADASVYAQAPLPAPTPRKPTPSKTEDVVAAPKTTPRRDAGGVRTPLQTPLTTRFLAARARAASTAEAASARGGRAEDSAAVWTGEGWADKTLTGRAHHDVWAGSNAKERSSSDSPGPSTFDCAAEALRKELTALRLELVKPRRG